MIKRKFTHKELMPVTGLSLDQEKKYAFRLFGLDEEAGLGRGAEREFTVDEGFIIDITGLLIEGYKLGVEEAVAHALNIFHYIMTGKKPVTFWGDEVPENIEELSQVHPALFPSLWWGRENSIPEVMIKIHPGRGYEVRVYSEGYPDEDIQDSEEETEKFKRRWISLSSKGRRSTGVELTIHLTRRIRNYLKGLQAS